MTSARPPKITSLVDDKNKKLKEGRSQDLKDALKGKVQETAIPLPWRMIFIEQMAEIQLITRRKVIVKKRGKLGKVKAWPALVDERDSVAIKLFDNLLNRSGNVEILFSPFTAGRIFHRRSSTSARKAAKQSQAWGCTLTGMAKCWS